MLAVSPSRSTRNEEQGEMETFSTEESHHHNEFSELSDASLLDSINFDDIFVGIHVDGDVLPDLEMDPEILADFSVSLDQYSPPDHITTAANKEEEEDKISSGLNSESSRSEEIASKREDKASQKERKSSAHQSKNNNCQGKRKVKVDWTPELHRRFVQAVEQLGVDKAVPSRILEIMEIDCLTRHNIASHLQKYRSHRKHLLAREAEAAKWSKRRQTSYGMKRSEASPWVGVGGIAPTMGFPPMSPPPMQHFRALHVWGHPTMDHSFIPLWPKHLPPHSSSPSPLAWAAPPPTPTPDPSSYWHPPQRAPNALTPGTPCFPPPLTPTTRFPSPPVPGIPPPHALYKVDPGIGVPTAQPGSGPRPLLDFHPSKESIDAAIGDVLSKPWLPLPLGLKAPALDSVMGELQRQGIPKVPPSCA